MTLTQAATLTRRGVIVFFVLLVLGISGKIGYEIWYQNYLAHLPKKIEKPEMKFGALPKINFPPTTISSSNYSYTLDTATGGLPQVPTLLKIYFIPKASISLLSPDKSQKLAAKLGFPNGPQVLSESVFQFDNGVGGLLKIDATTGNFNFLRASRQITPEEASDSGKYLNSTLPTKDELLQQFKDYLDRKELLPQELTTGKYNIIYQSQTPESSDTVEISLWPGKIDDLDIVTPSFSQGLTNATFTKWYEETNQVIKLNYTFWPIDQTSYSTYPLKTAEQAFTDLKAGQGFISVQSQSPQVSITLIYLAYFESEEYSPYLQPVFVFEGPSYIGLVPAVATSPSLQPTEAKKN